MSVYPRRRAADQPVSSRSHQRLRTAVALAVVGVLALGGAVAYVTGRLGHVTTSNCQQVEDVKKALRQIIIEAQTFAATSPVRTPQEKAQTVQFYSDALTRLASKSCP